MPMRRMSCCGEIQNGMGTRGCTPCDHSEFEDVPAGILFYQLDPPLADALDRPPLAEAFHRQVVPYPPPTRLTLGPVYNLVAAQDMPEDAQEQMQEQQELDEKAVLDAPRAQATPNGFYIGPCQLAVENSNSLGHVYQPSANQQQMTDVLYFQTASLQPTLAADGTRAIARQFAPFCLC